MVVCGNCCYAGRRAGNDAALHLVRHRQRPLLERNLERRSAAVLTCASETETGRDDSSVPRRRRLLRNISFRESDGTDHACRLRDERRTASAASRISVAIDCARALWREESEVVDANRASERSRWPSASPARLWILQRARLGS